jgi:hypothetical protein
MYYLLYIYREVHQREEKLPQKKRDRCELLGNI